MQDVSYDFSFSLRVSLDLLTGSKRFCFTKVGVICLKAKERFCEAVKKSKRMSTEWKKGIISPCRSSRTLRNP